MGRLAETYQFAEQVAKVTSTAELSRLMDEMTREMGFRYFALAHHVDHQVHRDGFTLVHNYPENWAEFFGVNKLYEIDPVFRASEKTCIGFAWSTLTDFIEINSQQRELLRSAEKHGVMDGVTIPIHVPGEPFGSCNFSTPITAGAHQEQLLQAQLVGAIAFEAARRLTTLPRRLESGRISLTERQRDCLVLAARGKTDLEIASTLNIGQETVRMHLKTARERYGVTRRITLAVRALYDGLVGFHEVIDPIPPFRE